MKKNCERTAEEEKVKLLQKADTLREAIKKLVDKLDDPEDLERIRRFVTYIYIRK